MKTPVDILVEYLDGIKKARRLARESGNREDSHEINRQHLMFSIAIRMLNLIFDKNGSRYSKKTEKTIHNFHSVRKNGSPKNSGGKEN